MSTLHAMIASRNAGMAECTGGGGILVAVDLAGRWMAPLRRACLLARQSGLRLTVLHVVDHDPSSPVAVQMMAGAREVIAAALRDIPDLEPGRLDIVVIQGEATACILDAARVGDCGLIVLGPHRMAAAGCFHCCTAEQILRATVLPVLTVHRGPVGAYRRVLAAVDFSAASLRGVHSAQRLAPQSELRLLHACKAPLLGRWSARAAHAAALRAADARLAGILESSNPAAVGGGSVAPVRVLRQGQALTVIEEEIRTGQPDLLVLGVHGGAPAEGSLGGLSHAFLNCPPCDVLFQPSTSQPAPGGKG